MTLIKSISGIRGTIGGHVGEGLNPLDIVKFTSAYATLIRKTTTVKSNKIVVGRDARISGEMVKNVVCGTLTVSYTHLRAHETGRNLVCRLLLEKKKAQLQKHER